MKRIDRFKSSTRLDILSFLLDKKKHTISKWFYRKWYSILENSHFQEYLNKFYKNK